MKDTLKGASRTTRGVALASLIAGLLAVPVMLLSNRTANDAVASATIAERVTSRPPQPAAAAAPATGQLEIASDPPMAEVTVDGTARGTTPITLDSMTAGEHIVSISNGDRTVSRTIRVSPGASSTVFVSMAAAPSPIPAPPAAERLTGAGWIVTRVPIELQIFENGRLIGVTTAERLMLPTGRHNLEFVNEPLKFREARSVEVSNGKVTSVAFALPNGSLSINALPWSEVWIDGRSVGLTPIANLAVPIGPHEITWKHPQLGEVRRTVDVTAQSPTRIGTDFNKK